MFCAYTRPRYHVSVYRVIGPLVISYKQGKFFSKSLNPIFYLKHFGMLQSTLNRVDQRFLLQLLAIISIL